MNKIATLLLTLLLMASCSGRTTGARSGSQQGPPSVAPTAKAAQTTSSTEADISISSLRLRRDVPLRVRDDASNEYLGSENLWQGFGSTKYSEIAVYAKYLVVQLRRDGGVANFAVFARTREDLLDNYFRQGTPAYVSAIAEWPIGIFGSLLFTDAGTAPGVRPLRIIDLSTGKLMFDGVWDSEPIVFIGDHEVTVFRYFGEERPNAGNPENLVDYTLHEYTFSLETGEETETGRTKVLIAN